MKTKKLHSASVLMITVTLLGGAATALAGGEPEAEFLLTPLNDSGVWAKAHLQLQGNRLHVQLDASGLEALKPHPQHIHGFDDNSKSALCPGAEADTNGDGVVSVGEGAVSFGPIILPLEPFNLVDENGNLSYEVTYTVAPSSLQPLYKLAIVLHGKTVNGTYIASLPIACGVISINR